MTTVGVTMSVSNGAATVVNATTGVLVDPNDVAGLAVVLDRLAVDPGLGAAGSRRVAEQFNVASLGQRLLPHYHGLLATS